MLDGASTSTPKAGRAGPRPARGTLQSRAASPLCRPCRPKSGESEPAAACRRAARPPSTTPSTPRSARGGRAGVAGPDWFQLRSFRTGPSADLVRRPSSLAWRAASRRTAASPVRPPPAPPWARWPASWGPEDDSVGPRSAPHMRPPSNGVVRGQSSGLGLLPPPAMSCQTLAALPVVGPAHVVSTGGGMARAWFSSSIRPTRAVVPPSHRHAGSDTPPCATDREARQSGRHSPAGPPAQIATLHTPPPIKQCCVRPSRPLLAALGGPADANVPDRVITSSRDRRAQGQPPEARSPVDEAGQPHARSGIEAPRLLLLVNPGRRVPLLAGPSAGVPRGHETHGDAATLGSLADASIGWQLPPVEADQPPSRGMRDEIALVFSNSLGRPLATVQAGPAFGRSPGQRVFARRLPGPRPRLVALGRDGQCGRAGTVSFPGMGHGGERSLGS